MPVTREGPDPPGLVTVLSAHSVSAKPFVNGPGWRLGMDSTEGSMRRVVGGVDTHKDLHVAAIVDGQEQKVA